MLNEEEYKNYKNFIYLMEKSKKNLEKMNNYKMQAIEIVNKKFSPYRKSSEFEVLLEKNLRKNL